MKELYHGTAENHPSFYYELDEENKNTSTLGGMINEVVTFSATA